MNDAEALATNGSPNRPVTSRSRKSQSCNRWSAASSIFWTNPRQSEIFVTRQNRGGLVRFLSRIKDLNARTKMAKTAAAEGWTVRATEQARCEVSGQGPPGPAQLARKNSSITAVRIQRLSLCAGWRRGCHQRSEFQANKRFGPSVCCGLPVGARVLSSRYRWGIRRAAHGSYDAFARLGWRRPTPGMDRRRCTSRCREPYSRCRSDEAGCGGRGRGPTAQRPFLRDRKK